MGRQPRSGDLSWLSAHSILNWIGGDIYMVDPWGEMSRISWGFFRDECGPIPGCERGRWAGCGSDFVDATAV